jgi:hypothetical protein
MDLRVPHRCLLVVASCALVAALGAPRRSAAQAPTIANAPRPDCEDLRPIPEPSLSPDSTWRLEIEVAEAGRRFMRLSRRATGEVRWAQTIDLVNYRWTRDGRWLVYAVSPIYDAPGIFVYDTRFETTTRLVAPQSKTRAYPDGTDWFVLCSLRLSSPGQYLLTYVRLPDVEAIDFAHPPANAPRFTIHLP